MMTWRTAGQRSDAAASAGRSGTAAGSAGYDASWAMVWERGGMHDGCNACSAHVSTNPAYSGGQQPHSQSMWAQDSWGRHQRWESGRRRLCAQDSSSLPHRQAALAASLSCAGGWQSRTPAPPLSSSPAAVRGSNAAGGAERDMAGRSCCFERPTWGRRSVERAGLQSIQSQHLFSLSEPVLPHLQLMKALHKRLLVKGKGVVEIVICGGDEHGGQVAAIRGAVPLQRAAPKACMPPLCAFQGAGSPAHALSRSPRQSLHPPHSSRP